MTDKIKDAEYSPEEAARRRDEVVKRMLATRPQPKFKPMKPQSSKPERPSDDPSSST